MTTQSDAAWLRSLFANVPKVVQVILFIALAVCFAVAGTLDDWVRVVLAVLFAGVALSLAAEGAAGVRAHRGTTGQPMPQVTTYPTAQYRPEPEAKEPF